MIAARLLQRIESNWERIAETIIAARQDDPALTHYRSLSDQELRERVRDFSTNLAVWLTSRDESRLSAHYEVLGRRRHSEGIPLFEVLTKITVIKRAIRTYATEQNLSLSAVEIYEELELLRAMAGFFDFVVCQVAKGYEEAWRAEEAAARQAA